MITIIEPKKQIADLWSITDKTYGNTYRLMQYVIQVEHDNQILLHNVVTGQLVMLEGKERGILSGLPKPYETDMEPLLRGHYLVPVQYDEHQKVKKIRDVLRLLIDAQPKPITSYTILPTTGCNARCYYCFEKDVKPVTMTEKTADDVVKYIVNHCGGKNIHILWFGGEPTIAANRIDQICRGLCQNGVQFQSSMVTNGYLFDEKMVSQAKALWNLYHVQISVDGTENSTNYIKDFANPVKNPYRRVIRNIELLISNEVKVSMRMNFDVGNADEFKDLVEEMQSKFQDNKLFDMYATPVLGKHPDKCGRILHGDDEWLENKIVELNDVARKAKLARNRRNLPCLEFVGCSAEYDSYMLISADGSLARCLELFDKEHIIGNVVEGVTNQELFNSWKVIADFEKCSNCTYFPTCVKMSNCLAGDRCYHLDRNMQFEKTIRKCYDDFIKEESNNVVS